MSAHPLALAGWLLLALALVFYLGGIALTVMRVARQYSDAMTGSRGLLVNAALAAAAARWFLLPIVALGAVLAAAGR